jgi:hypothetical protein
MKSEHRHELQTNELGKFAEKAAIYIDRHGNRLMIGICVVALALSGGIFWWRTQRGNQMAAWTDLSTAINNGKPEIFQSVWDDHKGTVPGLWAKVHEGDAWLGQGVEAAFRNVEKSAEDFKKARAAFEVVAGERRAPQEIRERALIGLARTLESMSDGSEDDAIKAYETFVKEFPKSEYQADAQSRIGILKSGHGQEFYAWFSKYPRPKIAEKLPRDQAGDDSDEESSLRDDMESALKGASKKKSADDAEDLTLPEGREGNEKTGQASETKDDGKTSAKPASDDGSDPKPTPPAEPQTQPE